MYNVYQHLISLNHSNTIPRKQVMRIKKNINLQNASISLTLGEILFRKHLLLVDWEFWEYLDSWVLILIPRSWVLLQALEIRAHNSHQEGTKFNGFNWRTAYNAKHCRFDSILNLYKIHCIQCRFKIQNFCRCNQSRRLAQNFCDPVCSVNTWLHHHHIFIILFCFS